MGLTQAVKCVKLYTENVLEEFYKHVLDGNIEDLHIPHSDVFYVRAAVENGTGIRYPLQQIETAMKAEGWNK